MCPRVDHAVDESNAEVALWGPRPGAVPGSTAVGEGVGGVLFILGRMEC